MSLLLPASADGEVNAVVSSGDVPRPDWRTNAALDGATGALRTTQDYDALPLGRRVRNWMRFMHTGEVWGTAGQVVMTLASLAGALLVYTGIALSIRRLVHWRRRRVSRSPITSCGCIGARRARCAARSRSCGSAPAQQISRSTRVRPSTAQRTVVVTPCEKPSAVTRAPAATCAAASSANSWSR
ncbi:MAG: PepSY domain-containing protein [Gemmatimonadetes bacterium]|nr:PepSY domain-containing protein [Gemmatimonadota bacterium]